MNNLEKSAFYPEMESLEKAKVKKPGSQGGKFYIDDSGNVRYGEKKITAYKGKGIDNIIDRLPDNKKKELNKLADKLLGDFNEKEADRELTKKEKKTSDILHGIVLSTSEAFLSKEEKEREGIAISQDAREESEGIMSIVEDDILSDMGVSAGKVLGDKKLFRKFVKKVKLMMDFQEGKVSKTVQKENDTYGKSGTLINAVLREIGQAE